MTDLKNAEILLGLVTPFLEIYYFVISSNFYSRKKGGALSFNF